MSLWFLNIHELLNKTDIKSTDLEYFSFTDGSRFTLQVLETIKTL